MTFLLHSNSIVYSVFNFTMDRAYMHYKSVTLHKFNLNCRKHLSYRFFINSSPSSANKALSKVTRYTFAAGAQSRSAQEFFAQFNFYNDSQG